LRVWQLFLFLAVGDTLWAYFFWFPENRKSNKNHVKKVKKNEKQVEKKK